LYCISHRLPAFVHPRTKYICSHRCKQLYTTTSRLPPASDCQRQATPGSNPDMLLVPAAVFIAFDVVFVLACSYQLYIERFFERSQITAIQHFLPRAMLASAILQIISTSASISIQVCTLFLMDLTQCVTVR
jgi:hypothetical protein